MVVLPVAKLKKPFLEESIMNQDPGLLSVLGVMGTWLVLSFLVIIAEDLKPIKWVSGINMGVGFGLLAVMIGAASFGCIEVPICFGASEEMRAIHLFTVAMGGVGALFFVGGLLYALYERMTYIASVAYLATHF